MKTSNTKRKPLYALQGLLKENNYTYEEMANKLGMSRTSFANKINRKVINGYNTDFTLGELERIGEFLGVKDMNIFLN